MKKQISNFTIFAILCVSFMTTGCATIFNSTPVNLYGYSNDMKVSENGVPLDVELTYVGHSGMAGYSSGRTYYGAGVMLKRSKQDHPILIESGGQKKEIVIKSKFATGALLADLFLSGPIGILVDFVAGPLRTTEIKQIDIQYELGNTAYKSKAKLKMDFKKSFKK